MTTPSARLDAMDPNVRRWLTKTAVDLGVNLLADDHEEQFYFPHPEFTDHDQRVARAIHSSMDNLAGRKFSDVNFAESCILSGFECATQNLPYEVGLFAWTDEDNPEVFRYLAANRGSASSVALPLALVMPTLHARIRRRTPTRLLAVHNHPRTPLKDLFEDILGNTLGPSGTDRSTTWSWLNIKAESNGVIQPEFVLHERGNFRRIRWPSAETLVEICARMQVPRGSQDARQSGTPFM